LTFEHEHQRPDRDNYVDIFWNNIEPNYKYAFDKLSTPSCATKGEFDFNSIMIYGSTAFGRSNSSTTMLKKDGNPFTDNKYISQRDKQMIQDMYIHY
jgi:hypothetical protein